MMERPDSPEHKVVHDLAYLERRRSDSDTAASSQSRSQSQSQSQASSYEPRHRHRHRHRLVERRSSSVDRRRKGLPGPTRQVSPGGLSLPRGPGTLAASG